MSQSKDAVDYRQVLAHPSNYLDEIQMQWLRPLTTGERIAQRGLHIVNRWIMRACFRLQVIGQQHLVQPGPFVLAPNHTSSLDGPALGAALPYAALRRTHWAGRKGAVLTSATRRYINRLAQTVPVDRDMSALAMAATVLQRGHNLVWFPEGTRTLTGDVQRFRRGIAFLLQHFDVPAIPVLIRGAYRALPAGRRLPRPTTIEVIFGAGATFRELARDMDGTNEQKCEAVAALLRRRVLDLEGIAHPF